MKKAIIYFVLVLLTGMGVFHLGNIEKRQPASPSESKEAGQLEARSRTRCGRGGRCTAGLNQVPSPLEGEGQGEGSATNTVT